MIWYLYILHGFKTSDDAFRLSYSIAFDCSIRPFLDLFHSWLYIFHLSRFSEDGLVVSFLQVCSASLFLVVAFGLFSRHDMTIPNKLFLGYVIQKMDAQDMIYDTVFIDCNWVSTRWQRSVELYKMAMRRSHGLGRSVNPQNFTAL